MAKKPRMGRNLNALLGSSARERTSAPPGEKPLPAAESAQQEADTPASTGPRTADKPTVTSAADNPRATEPHQNESLPRESGKSAGSSNVTRLSPVESPARTSVVQPVPNTSAPVTDAHAAVSANTSASSTDDTSGSATDRLRMIGVDQIRRGTYQPRRHFDQELLQELADSIKAEGMIQPIIVRPFAGAYELVAGERRWRAAQLAGLSQLPAIVRDMEDKSVAAVALIENIQRKDLNPLEEAAAFERLCDEFGMTHKAVAESVGRSRASVTNLLRLLELHDEVKVMVDKGELEMGHARAILGAPKDQQFDLARRTTRDGLTVRAVEKLVRDLNKDESDKTERPSAAVVDPDIERLSQKLGETLGAAVRIQHRSTGSGKLEISYSSVSELQGILAHIK